MDVLNKPVVFRSNRGDRLGIIKGIYDGKNRGTIATIQLDESEKKSTPFDSFLSVLERDDSKLVHIPLNFLHILKDASSLSKTASLTDDISSLDAPPPLIVFKNITYNTLSAKQREAYNISFNPGDQVIWNKASTEGGSGNLGVVFLLARSSDKQYNGKIRAYVDFDEQLPPLYNEEQTSTIHSSGKVVVFRYCVPYEELTGLQDYLASFQQYVEQRSPGNSKASSVRTKSEGKGSGSEKNIFSGENDDTGSSSSSGWQPPITRKPPSQNEDVIPNKNNTSPTSPHPPEYFRGSKKYFGVCCSKNKRDIKVDDIPIDSTVAYLSSIYEPVAGKILWTGTVALARHHHLERTMFVQVQFESGISDYTYHIEHVEYCEYYSRCRENKVLYITVEDLKDRVRFTISPRNFNTQHSVEEPEAEEENKESVSEIPAPLHMPSIIERLKQSDSFGLHGSNNSCYADAPLFSLFAFTDVFDDYLLNRLLQRDDEASSSSLDNHVIHKKTLRILRESIVAPLRKNFLVPKESVARLRRVLGNINRDFKYSHMDVDDFLLCLFDTVLGCPPFFHCDEDSMDYIHQIVLPYSPTVEKVMQLQVLVESSFLTTNVMLDNVPYPGFIIKLPVSEGRLACSKYVMPPVKLDMTRILRNPKGKTSMELLSVICLRDHRFTCYIRKARDWLFYDSNPNGQVPKVVHLPYLNDAVEELSKFGTFKSKQPFRKEDDKHAKLLMSTANICIYI